MKRTRKSLIGKLAGILVSLAILVTAVVLGRQYFANAERNPHSQDAVLNANVAKIASAVPGRIATIAVKENGSVAKGDLLFSLDAEPYRLQVAQAAADLQIAEAAYGEAVPGTYSSTIEAAASWQEMSIQSPSPCTRRPSQAVDAAPKALSPPRYCAWLPPVTNGGRSPSPVSDMIPPSAKLTALVASNPA